MLVYKYKLAPNEYHNPDTLFPFMFWPKYEESKFLVIVAFFDYTKSFAVEDQNIGEYPFVPSISLIVEKHEFESEKEAINFMKEWWSKKPIMK